MRFNLNILLHIKINMEDNMSIYYGSKEVKIIQDLEGEDVKVQYGDRVMDVPVIELEADGGIYEIHDAVKELKNQK
jgi:hypothetical protein